MSNKFKIEQRKSINAPMTTCEYCQEFKYVTYDHYRQAWFCFDCAKEIKIQRQKKFNPSKRRNEL